MTNSTSVDDSPEVGTKGPELLVLDISIALSVAVVSTVRSLDGHLIAGSVSAYEPKMFSKS